MKRFPKLQFLVLIMTCSLCGPRLNAQVVPKGKGIFWTIEPSQTFGFGNVNYQNVTVPYNASTLALGSTVGYRLNEQSALGAGLWVNAFSQAGNDNLAMPFYLEYTYAFKPELKTTYVLARIGNSFKFGEASEVEDGIHFHVQLGFRKLAFGRRFFLNPFVGLVLQQIKDDSTFVTTGNRTERVTDNVTFSAVQAGLTFFIIK